MDKVNHFKKDDVEVNRLWGFDYCFCHSDCDRKDCGRNTKSESFKLMMCQPNDSVYTASDLSQVCSEYKKPTVDEEDSYAKNWFVGDM